MILTFAAVIFLAALGAFVHVTWIEPHQDRHAASRHRILRELERNHRDGSSS